MAQDARRYTSFCAGYKAQGFTGSDKSKYVKEKDEIKSRIINQSCTSLRGSKV